MVSQRVAQLQRLAIVDFSGGWNIRDAPTELGPNESPDMQNMTLDERGGFQKRLGFRAVNTGIGNHYTGGTVKNTFWWDSGAHTIVQAGASLFRDTETTSVRVTFSTADRVGFADFMGKLWVIHPVDGIYSSTDGITYTAVAGSPKGTVLLPSKNRLIALGDPANVATLYGSRAGDATDWTTGPGAGWTNQIREVDSSALVTMAAIGGGDVLGRPGFMLFKGSSFYRVYDSDTGAYTTMDATIGAASSIAAVGFPGGVAWISPRGIFRTDGVTPGAKLASAKLQPLFQASQIAYDKLSLFCAGAKGDRVHFSLPRAGSTKNDVHLEYHPALGWIAPHTDAATCYTTVKGTTEKLYGGYPSATVGDVCEFGTGALDGAQLPLAFTAYYQTRWFEPMRGVKTSFRSVRVFGRGINIKVYTTLDFDKGTGNLETISLPGGALVWGQGTWGVDKWAPGNYEDQTDLWSLGAGTAISFKFVHDRSGSSSGVQSGQQILGSGPAPEAGEAAIYKLLLQFIPTGS